MRTRAALVAHVNNTKSQYNLPEIGKKIAYTTNRDGVAERCADPAVPKSIAVDLALLTSYGQLLGARELARVKAATHHDANTLYRLHTVPGIGTILRLVLLTQSTTLPASPGCSHTGLAPAYGKQVSTRA